MHAEAQSCRVVMPAAVQSSWLLQWSTWFEARFVYNVDYSRQSDVWTKREKRKWVLVALMGETYTQVESCVLGTGGSYHDSGVFPRRLN